MDYRDDNSQWKQQQDEEEWWEKNHRILAEFDKLRPIILGTKHTEAIMDEVWQEQQEQENESGADMAECYEWHEKNRMLLDGFDKIRPLIKPEKKQTETYPHPF